MPGFGQNTGRSLAVTSRTGRSGAVGCASAIDVREPARVRRIAAVDGVEEHRLQTRRDRSARAVADRTMIELADRRDLGRRSGEERFVCDVDLVARDAPLE